MSKIFPCAFIAISLSACFEGKRLTDVDTTQYQLYNRIPASESGLKFENRITENIQFNTSLYDNIMTGGGVGFLDVNNDGLLDIYLAGNMVEDQLYLNKGGLHFEDISEKAGIASKSNWTSGVTIADVNGDGWDDIYVCKHIYDDPSKRMNLYYENQKDGTFRERASELGIADAGYSIIANFFDYDIDGDLDLYVGNQPPSSLYERPKLKGLRDYRFTNRLYRNDQTRFVDVTVPAGVRTFCYSLSINTSDLNGDMLPDIYVAADYEEPDIMFLNQGNGTFKDGIHSSIRHMCNFGMGTDIADINNDGYVDIFTADMVAEDHYRNKTNMSGMNPDKFWTLANHGYHYQYMFNAMQLNNGNGSFSEIAQLSGISHTDWTWSAFFVDADHDGFRDLFVGNGQMKDVRNKDYDIKRTKLIEGRDTTEDMHKILFEISQMAPTQRIKNYMFRNNGDLTFTNVADAWGMTDKTWTQGAAYGDLDNDGDLDIVIHNTNDPVMLYASQVNDLRINNYITVRVKGPDKNTRGINAKVTVACDESRQVGEISPVRGYMSSVEPIAHFGLGKCNMISEVIVEWPDGAIYKTENVESNQTLIVNYDQAQKGAKQQKTKEPTFFEEMQNSEVVAHTESTYDDYKREILLPYKLSTLGPVASKADVNGDGLEDFYLGGAAGNPGTLYIQNTGGQFEKQEVPAFLKDAGYEDGCATFLDADRDKDIDLYVCSGSNEFEVGSGMYQDRLYINDGKGGFSRSSSLPQISSSTSIALPLDFDGDSDTDLFVGARQIPGQYGRAPRSLLLKNENGKYIDIGETALPREGRMGMVTDAHWVEAPGAMSQLVIAGEFMRIQMFQWSVDHFEENPMPGLEKSEGLWNRIIPVDIDADGDLDIVAGNCGLNMKYSATSDKPFRMVVNDFDANGSNDVYLGYYDKLDGQCYPVRGRECSSQQMPFVKAKFASYSEFAQATMDKVLEGRMEGAEELRAYNFASGIYVNEEGAFEFEPFENIAQLSPVYGIVVNDFNGDQKPDLFLAGNYYNREVETTRSDAGIGNLLLSRPEGGFEYVHPSKTGVLAYQDVRNVLLLKRREDTVLAIANNNASMQFYRSAGKVNQ